MAGENADAPEQSAQARLSTITLASAQSSSPKRECLSYYVCFCGPNSIGSNDRDLAPSCRTACRNTRPFAEELRSLHAKGDSGAGSMSTTALAIALTRPRIADDHLSVGRMSHE